MYCILAPAPSSSPSSSLQHFAFIYLRTERGPFRINGIYICRVEYRVLYIYIYIPEFSAQR